jgi:cobalt-zinc-cadmium efflux system outer membrane protein
VGLRHWIGLVGLGLVPLPLGCATPDLAQGNVAANRAEAAPSAPLTEAVHLTAFSEPAGVPGRPALTTAPGQPESVGPAESTAPGTSEPVPAPGSAPPCPGPGPLTLADLEGIALANNPTLAQAAARVGAARAEALQSGLWPNPVAGYLGQEIGNEGRAGQQGFYLQQEFITGGKLQLSRRTAEQVAQQREFELAAQRFRVINDVRTQFFEVLTAQRQAELARERVRFLTDSAERADRLQKVGEAAPIEALQLRIDAGQANLAAQALANHYFAAWRRLAAVAGAPDQQPVPLDGQLETEPPLRHWHVALATLLDNSPELAAVAAEISEARWALERAQAEPIPNVTVQTGAQYDNATRDTWASVQVGMPLPVYNRNQGGIAKAQADLAVAQRKLNGAQLALQTRLAGAFERYSNARQQVEGYARDIEPKARQAQSILEKYYRADRGVPALQAYLAAQRTLFETQLAYLGALKELHQSVIALDGLVLTGSLSTVAAE